MHLLKKWHFLTSKMIQATIRNFKTYNSVNHIKIKNYAPPVSSDTLLLKKSRQCSFMSFRKTFIKTRRYIKIEKEMKLLPLFMMKGLEIRTILKWTFNVCWEKYSDWIFYGKENTVKFQTGKEAKHAIKFITLLQKNVKKVEILLIFYGRFPFFVFNGQSP